MPKPKRKKATKSVFEELEDFLPVPNAPIPGYQDQHTHYEKIDGRLDLSHDTVYVPPSPVKTRPTKTLPPSTLTSVEKEPSVDWFTSLKDAPSLWDNNVEVEVDDSAPLEGAPAEETSGKKRKRTASVSFKSVVRGWAQFLFLVQDDPKKLFMEKADEYLDELIRLDGIGDADDFKECTRCGVLLSDDGSPYYRCRDCPPMHLWCKNCLVEDHRRLYLHRTEVCWVCVSLNSSSSHGLFRSLTEPISSPSP